eukprot:TRINITY_DN26322_c0_g1_i1.p1 TRINITY_DN26322_c0_g1~~TRINITY_DN26322_c0_g1_i1.p1  ORF type:complete len:344 (+),score=114.12 TRINITY_DN26322_c0_g1_i1:53-1033(+)
MGNKKGKSLSMGELQKKMKVTKAKEGSAKEGRKNAKSAAKRAREGKVVEGGKSVLVHPKSRKAMQLMRSITNDAKKAERETVKSHKELARVKKFVWFKDKIEEMGAEFDSLKCLTPEMVQTLCKTFVKRHDDELTKLREKRTLTASYRYMPEKGREKDLVAFRTEEIKQAKSGELEIPFVSSKNGLKMLRLWDRQPGTLHTVPSTTVAVEEDIDELSFSLGNVTPDKIKQLKQKVLANHAARKSGLKAPSATNAVRKTLHAASVKDRRAQMLSSLRSNNEGDNSTVQRPNPLKKPSSAAQLKVKKAQARAAETAAATPFQFEPVGK